MTIRQPHKIQMIPVKNIRVLNPRVRNGNKFTQIVNNISNIGLKRPITVSHYKSHENEDFYDLVCGQGRLEAFIVLKQKEIPAIVINVPKEDCFLMSLVENLARRRHMSIELVREIRNLKDRGYKFKEIADKTDTNPEYVRGVIRLLNCGEEILINAVENGKIPISIAVEISAAEKEDAQLALLKAYESRKLKGRALTITRRLIERRRIRGKTSHGPIPHNSRKHLTASAVIRTFTQEVERQRLFVKKAKLCEARLTFIVTGLKTLLENENFVNLLRAESLNNMPKYIADQIKSKGKI
jgi:ParB family transcriptional regulator, chromosome partitioning protein